MSSAAHGRDEGPFDLGAGRVASRVHDACERVATLAGEEELGLFGIEASAEGGELAYAVRALGHQDAHGLDVAQSGARGERVGEMQLGRVGLGERGCDTALRVARGGVRELTFGQHEHRQASTGRVERGRQPRDAAP